MTFRNKALAAGFEITAWPATGSPTCKKHGIAVARKRGRRPGRPALDLETVSAAQTLVEAGLMAGQAAKQLGIGRATVYRITKAAR